MHESRAKASPALHFPPKPLSILGRIVPHHWPASHERIPPLHSLVRHREGLGLAPLLALGSLCLVALTAGALPDDDRLCFTPFGGVVFWSDRSDLEASWEGGLALGLLFNRHFGTEASFGLNPARTLDDAASGSGDVLATRLAFDFVYRPLPERRLQPYVSAGLANVRYTSDDLPAIADDYMGFGLGGGVLYRLRETTETRTLVRLDVRDHFAKFNSPLPSEAEYNASNFVVSVGVSFEFGGDSHKDSDADGVIDKQDACEDTAIGVVVDGVGCPVDSDGDKIFDGPDQCDATPVGAVVDSLGCPIDSDGDKIFDGLDTCDATPAGAVVDDKGCPLDTDNDKVFDGLDLCPTTPTAVLVDANGCPRIDSDQERSFYETGKLILPEIEFESGKSELLPQGRASLAIVGDVIRKWPDVVIEIGGYTDNRGNASNNVKLSQERADAVREYLTQRYRHIKAEQLTAKGYGPEQPIADNNTEEGRKLNRRIEFTIVSGKPEIR